MIIKIYLNMILISLKLNVFAFWGVNADQLRSKSLLV